ncbi:MAG: YggS family pyridoxal phosphate-dependent enzyme [Rhodospirillaceae bacterium]|nr:YggS family pyridoxal phosphate-dependent enzyme [Rhodospirillaceae bacterium]
MNIADKLTNVLSKINQVSIAAGRDSGSVSLVAVSKVQDSAAIEQALNAGHRVFGENRIQEAKEKWPPLKSRYPGVELHLIGPLQTNKVKEAVSLFDVIETIDRPKLARALKQEMVRQSVEIPCFVQINTGEEKQKTGIFPDEAVEFIEYCRRDLCIKIEGLMCIPPIDEEPALHFSLLKSIAKKAGVLNLSMGMSDDFDVAIEIGATHIRLGTLIFGKRPS